jgi:hypothetical protein
MRVAACDVSAMSIVPPRAGRLSLNVEYQAGLNRVKRSFWVESRHEAALSALVMGVRDSTPVA